MDTTQMFAHFRWSAALLAMFIGGALVVSAEVHVTDATAKHAAIKKPAPEYTEAARQMKATGKVELEVSITPAGTVEDVKIISGNPFLTRPCAKAVKDWQFTPFSEGGQPVKAIATLTFEFRQ